MFSSTAEYALRAIVWLAENGEDGPVGNQRIAEFTQVPSTYLAKILQQLTKAGLVDSRRGAGGGFSLAHEASEISVLEVVNAVDPIQRYTDCPLKLKSHKKRRCSMHANLDQAIQSAQEVLANSTIEELLNDRSRPKPLQDKR